MADETIPEQRIAATITTVKQFEAFLRRAGWSKRAARSIACNGFRGSVEIGAADTAELLKELAELLTAGIDWK